MNYPSARAVVIALIAPFAAAIFAGGKANMYVNLNERPIWSFDADQRRTIVMVRENDTIQGTRCHRVEWHFGQIRPTPFYCEYWFAKEDSIFCAGARVLGNTVMYPRPYLVIANGTKPGDSWKVPSGARVFIDTVLYKAEKIDTLELPSGTVAALLITRTAKGTVQRRWFAKGKGLVRETREDTGGFTPVEMK